MASRRYAQIECFLHKDERFLALDHPTRLTWTYLLGNSSKVFCPGLVEGSCLTIAKYLYWPLRVSESQKFTRSVNSAVECIKALVKMGWVEHDLQAELFWLPHAVRHNIPENPNMLIGWLKKLPEFPTSPLTWEWVKVARQDLAKALGRDDSRAKLIDAVYRSGLQRLPKEPPYPKKEKGFWNGYPEGYPNLVGDLGVNPLLTIKRKSKSKSKVAPDGRDEPTLPGLEQGKKTKEPPSHFSKRQRDLWTIFLSEKFWVKGRGELTPWEGIQDPVAICEKLGGDGYKEIDLDLMYRLSAWTFAHKPKTRENLGSFLTSCFGAEKTRAAKRRLEGDNAQADQLSKLPAFDATDIGQEPTPEESSPPG